MIYFSENERWYSTQWGRPLLNRLIQLRSTIWSTCCMCPICGPDMWCTRPDSVAYPYYVFLRCENMFDGLLIDWILQNNSTSPNLRASQSPLRKIRMILDRIQIRKWIGEKARINVQYITSCRPWKTWFLDLNVVIWKLCVNIMINNIALRPIFSFCHVCAHSSLAQVAAEAPGHLPRRNEAGLRWAPCLYLLEKSRRATETSGQQLFPNTSTLGSLCECLVFCRCPPEHHHQTRREAWTTGPPRDGHHLLREEKCVGPLSRSGFLTQT